MKTGLDTKDLAAELQRRAESAEDYVADTRTMGFWVEQEAEGEIEQRTVTLKVDGPDDDRSWEGAMNGHAQNQIAQRLGIPFRFFERMRDDHPDILQETVGKLFVREPERRMVRTLDDVGRAFLSDRYRRIDNYAIASRSVFPALAEADQGFKVLSAGLTDTRMYLKLIWPDLGGDLVDGAGRTRVVHPGISISNSEVGAGAFGVEPFTFDSYCENGCIFGLNYAEGWGMRRQHVGARIEDPDGRIFSDETMRKDDDALLAMAADMVRSASSAINFEAMLKQLRDMATTRAGGDNPVQAVEHLARAINLGEGEQAAVMAHLIEGGDLSRYGFWSAVTRTASDAESYDRATELERIGGKVAAWTEREWDALAAA